MLREEYLPVLSKESLQVRRSAPSRAKGGIVVSNDGKEFQRDMVQCCHCSLIFQWVKGSGRIRGLCLRCNRLTCGRPQCDICVPIEMGLEMAEAGIPFHLHWQMIDRWRVSVSVPAEVPKKIILGG